MIIGTGPENTPPANERILLCFSPSPFSIRLVRATQRMAENLQAEWFAVYGEMPSHARLPQEDQDRVSNTLRFAAQLGAQTFTLSGFSLRETILQFARENHVTKIVVGKPIRRRWRERLFGSVEDQLIWNCGKIDIHVISGEAGESRTLSPGGQRSQPFPAPGRRVHAGMLRGCRV